MIIKNCHVALPNQEQLQKKDIHITNGKIKSIADSIDVSDEPVLDASGYEVFPGGIDPHVHFDEPGFTHREDFYHGSMAAARGGITTVIDMPCTSIPPVISKEALLYKLSHIQSQSVIDFALFGGVSGVLPESILASFPCSLNSVTTAHHDDSMLEAMEALAAYVVGFKCYFISGMETFTAVDHARFRKAVVKAAELKRPLLLHAEDSLFIVPATQYWKARAQAENRPAQWDDYVNARCELAELSAIASACALAWGYTHALHIVHVGTAEAAEIAANAGATAETCPHYLAFSREDFAAHGAALKTAPPVKALGQTEKLWRLVSHDVLAFIASDHAPAPLEEKHTGSIWTDYGGIPGTGTLFPYLYSEGYQSGRISLKQFTALTSGNAARRYGLDSGKGSIEPGKDADLVFIHPQKKYTVRGENLLSKGTLTPFEGKTFDGFIELTMVRGTIVWDARSHSEHPQQCITVKPGYGKYLQWGYA
ncbi:MAG TPA: amidohydrolase family protein [Spirochaetales bacterium]|nr:amidohydrolase family protein [Spirochaetales bacterium]HQK33745.1 amidohydrolase family protein [Spirochaetales bacterium]